MMEKQTLGMMISSLRKENGMTQMELAKKIGVTDKAVSKWERDLSCPDINTFPKIAEIFGVSVDELMQIKSEGQSDEKETKVQDMINLICKAVACAMGVGVVVLSILKEIDMYSGFTMLGIGLVCVSLSLLQNQNKN